MGRAIQQIAAHFNWHGPFGVGFPGVVHGPKILTSANLHAKFIGCDAEKVFSKATRSPVALLNDAAAAGLAEMKFGAGRGFLGKTLVLTLGTGVGSVLAYQGSLTLAAQWMEPLVRGDEMKASLGIAGGLIVACIAVVILNLRKVPLADYLRSARTKWRWRDGCGSGEFCRARWPGRAPQIPARGFSLWPDWVGKIHTIQEREKMPLLRGLR
jgi:hypothetical protein